MKVFLILSALFLASYFEATVGQDDADIRFQKFTKDAFAAFPNWLIESGHAPEHIEGVWRFKLQSESEANGAHFNLFGNISNRFHHGAEKSIKEFNISSDLSRLGFGYDIVHGDGENNFIEGDYFLGGTIAGWYEIHGDGKFNRTTLQRTLSDFGRCWLEVTDDGHFKIISAMTSISPVSFQDFTLYGLDEDTARKNLEPAFTGYYKSQFEFEGPRLSKHFMMYMNETFAVTPIADIIGEEFSPKLTTSAKDLPKLPNNSKTPMFDKENNVWRQVTYTSF